jgi:hypothetical protein
MAESISNLIEPMEARHFDATTQYILSRRGRAITESVIEAARLVLVYGLDPAEVRQIKRYVDVTPSRLWAAVRRYPRAFKQVVAESNRVAVTVICHPKMEAVLRAMDAIEVDEVMQLHTGKSLIERALDPAILEQAMALVQARDSREKPEN